MAPFTFPAKLLLLAALTSPAVMGIPVTRPRFDPVVEEVDTTGTAGIAPTDDATVTDSYYPRRGHHNHVGVPDRHVDRAHSHRDIDC